MHFIPSLRTHAVALLAVCFVALAAPTARAADPDAAILPFLDEGTFLVVRLDTGKVDQDGFDKLWEEFMGTALKVLPIPEAQQPRFRQEAGKFHQSAKPWMTDMDAAGGKQVYVLLDTADLLAGAAVPFIVVVPVTEGANVEAIRGLLLYERRPNDVVELGNAVVLADNAQVERLKKRSEPRAPKLKRPNLAAAFAAAGDTPVWIALLPTESSRTLFEKAAASFPEGLGLGDGKVISRGLRYAAVAMPTTPEAPLRFTLCGNDAAATKALTEAVNKGKAYAKTMLTSFSKAEEVVNGLDTLTPEVANDTVSLKLPFPLASVSFFGFGVQYENAASARPAPGQPGKVDDGGL